jgi:hypothetical protein
MDQRAEDEQVHGVAASSHDGESQELQPVPPAPDAHREAEQNSGLGRGRSVALNGRSVRDGL